MSIARLQLLAVLNNKENHVEVLKDFQKYHFDLAGEVILHAILYLKLLIYLRKLHSLQKNVFHIKWIIASNWLMQE